MFLRHSAWIERGPRNAEKLRVSQSSYRQPLSCAMTRITVLRDAFPTDVDSVVPTILPARNLESLNLELSAIIE